MDGEDNPPYDLRYNGEFNKNSCMYLDHAEDSFEANNRNIIKVRSKSRNKIVQSKTQAKPIDLSRTAHPKSHVFNLRHESGVHSQPGVNWRKKHESSALAAAV